ncbi:5407_t:CDS:1, partial [Racocetra persica]
FDTTKSFLNEEHVNISTRDELQKKIERLSTTHILSKLNHSQLIISRRNEIVECGTCKDDERNDSQEIFNILE